MSYELCRQNLAALIEWYGPKHGVRNEATTRLHLIDRIFFECLGWKKEDVVLEERLDGEYADYVFSTFRPALIVEAKREGEFFELPVGSKRIERSLRVMLEDFPAFKAAVVQACGYCQTRSIPYCVVTNGQQLVAFIGARSDGIPALQAQALVFDSLESMLENFLDLWQALSPVAITNNNLRTRLIPGQASLPSKLSATLSNFPGLKNRNTLQTDLQILSELVIEDLTRTPELEEQFLMECYCQSGALSQFSLTSREILATRYAALFDAEQPGPSTASVTTKEGVSPELIGASIARRPILLLGDVGVGKTTFIRNLVKREAANIFKNAISLHINLGSQATLSSDLKNFVLDEFESQLLRDYGIDVTQKNFVRGVYDLELKRFRNGIYSDLRTVLPEAYAVKELEELERLVGRKDQHLRNAFGHIAKAQRKQIIVFLDNADQRDEPTQESAFLIAQELAEYWPAMVFVALRPETFHRSKKIGALTGYHAKAFTIPPPRIDQVIFKRLAFALKITKGEIPLSRLDHVGVNLEKLRDIIQILIRSLELNDTLLEFIENVSAGNVRLALDLIKVFIGSGHVDTQKMLQSKATYKIPFHQLLRAVIYGDAEFYDSDNSVIVNVHDISTLDGKEHFCLPLTLGYLARTSGPHVQQGFVDTPNVYAALQAMGFLPEQIDFAIFRACEKKLIETSARQLPKRGEAPPQALRATPAGLYHIDRLAMDYQYYDAIVVDTPVLDVELRSKIDAPTALEKRFKRVEVFLDYLGEHWKGLSGCAIGYNWILMDQTVRKQMDWIRKHR